MFERRKKHTFLKLFCLLVFSAAIGMMLGYASVRYKGFPFNEKLNPPAPSASPSETITIPSPEPIYTSISENDKIEAENEPEETQAQASSDYIVKASEGKVYLYKIDADGNMSPEMTLPINLNSLKEEDKKLLNSGIPIKNKQDLAFVLEDFGS